MFLLRVPNPRSMTASRRPARIPLLVMTLLIAAALAACGSAASSAPSKLSSQTGPAGSAAWQELVKKAKAEGEVVLYGANASDTLNQLATAFERQYGIKVVVYRAVDSDLEPKLGAEAKSGHYVADVVGLSDEGYLKTMTARGAFADPLGPALKAPGFDRAANTLTPDVIRSVATTMSYAWNTNLHPQGLRGFKDLLDPSLSGGKIGILSPFTPAVWDFYSYLAKYDGADYLQKLAAQHPHIYPTGAALAQALASGEIAAATQVTQVALYAAKDAGAPVDGGLAHPAWAASLYEAVMAHAPHPDAAQLLMNYMFTPAGQEILANRIASVLPDIPGTATTVNLTTTGGVMNASRAKFNDFVGTFNQLFH